MKKIFCQFGNHRPTQVSTANCENVDDFIGAIRTSPQLGIPPNSGPLTLYTASGTEINPLLSIHELVIFLERDQPDWRKIPLIVRVTEPSQGILYLLTHYSS